MREGWQLWHDTVRVATAGGRGSHPKPQVRRTAQRCKNTEMEKFQVSNPALVVPSPLPASQGALMILVPMGYSVIPTTLSSIFSRLTDEWFYVPPHCAFFKCALMGAYVVCFWGRVQAISQPESGRVGQKRPLHCLYRHCHSPGSPALCNRKMLLKIQCDLEFLAVGSLA